jgi:hypothetical protein
MLGNKKRQMRNRQFQVAIYKSKTLMIVCAASHLLRLPLVRHRSGAASAFGGFLHQQDQRQAGGKHNGQKKEDVDVAHHGGLLLDHAVQSGCGLLGGGGGIHAAGHEGRFHLGQHVLCQRIVRIYVCRKGIGVDLSMAR